MMRDRRFRGFLAMHYGRHGDWSSAQLEVERMGQVTGERVVLANGHGRIIADSEGELIGQPVGRDWPTPAAQIVHDRVPVGALYVGVPDWPALPGDEGFLVSLNRTLLLVAVHLTLNLPLAWRHLTRRSRPTPRAGPRADSARRSLTLWVTIAAGLAGAFVLGMRHGRATLALTWTAGGGANAQVLGPVGAITEYHEYSSHSRSDVFAQAPSVDWGSELPEYKPYPDLPRVSLPPPAGFFAYEGPQMMASSSNSSTKSS